MHYKLTVILIIGLILGIFAGRYLSSENAVLASLDSVVESAEANPQSPYSPVEPLAEHDVYYPGTEALGPDEMRVVALGTGMPTIRPKQAAAAFLVELGNGDKFLFDIGYGSVERLSAMKIPMDYLDKVARMGPQRRNPGDGHGACHRRAQADAALGCRHSERPAGPQG